MIIQEPLKGCLAPAGDDKGLAEGMQWVMEQKRRGEDPDEVRGDGLEQV